MKQNLVAAAFALGMLVPSLGNAQDIDAKTFALEEAVVEAYGLDYERKDEINATMLEVATKAEVLLAKMNDDLTEGQRLDLLSVIGQAYFGAAQHFDSEWGSEEDLIDRGWLIKALEALRPVVAARPNDTETPAYDYRGATGQLWEHARYYDLPDKIERSAERIKANRIMLARFPDSELERQFLAESLYEHSWLTKDETLRAEADAIFESFPEDDKPYTLTAQREAMAEGRAPYAAAGEIFW